MVILVDDEVAVSNNSGRRFRAAPPVSSNIGGKEWDAAYHNGASSNSSSAAARERRGQYEHSNEPLPERKAPVRLESEGLSRANSQSTAKASAGRSQNLSASQGDLTYGVASGDVSEFSFQLK
jgi:hypothetical protein